MNKQITFGKDQYHLHEEMINWCRTNVGQGGWTGMQAHYENQNEWLWDVHSMFGNTTFQFKNESDFEQFKKTWSKN